MGKYQVKRDVREFLSFGCRSNFMFYPHEETHSTKHRIFFENIITKKDLYHVVKEIKEMRYTMIRKLFQQSRP